MKSVDAQNLLSKIDIAINDINSFTGISLLQKSYLAKFLVVYICGIYEAIIETLVNEMVTRLGSTPLSNYVENQLNKHFRNPDMGNLKGLLGQFDTTWKDTISSLPNNSTEAIDNIVKNKNAIAHGELCTITLIDAIDYYQKSKIVIEKIDDILL